jgi:hypothetical protein
MMHRSTLLPEPRSFRIPLQQGRMGVREGCSEQERRKRALYVADG